MSCFLQLFTLLLMALAAAASADVEDVHTAAETDTRARSCFVDGWQEPLRCYRVPVADGQLEISVLVAPALNFGGREPLYLLAGGPGQAASDLAPLLNSFRRINRERAIVLVDRRGAGRSNAFDCGFGAEMPFDIQAFTTQLAKCYSAQSARAMSLNSHQAVVDLEAVRQFLGHHKIAVWGGSWGTRTALVYQQMYPQALAALVLDGVAPIASKVLLSAAAAERALLQLQEDCQRDSVCASLGAWRPQLDQLLDNWSAAQAQRFPDPLTGAPAAQPVEAWVLASAVRAALYDPTVAAQLPFAIQQAGRGNFLPLSGLTGVFVRNSSAMSMGLTFSVACAEEMNRISAADIAADSANSFVGEAFIRLFVHGCGVWSVPVQAYPKPQPQAQPVLLISGSADPITPPRYAQQQLDYLAHKQHLIVAGGGHINSMRGCIPDLIAEFLDAPEVPLDDSCVAEIKRPPFMADTFGPALGVAGVAEQPQVEAVQ